MSTKKLESKQKLIAKLKLQYPNVEICEKCAGVWEIPNKYDHCPICKIFCFTMMSRTQAVHHIADCFQTFRGTSKDV